VRANERVYLMDTGEAATDRTYGTHETYVSDPIRSISRIGPIRCSNQR
jgi:hypothetical protein